MNKTLHFIWVGDESKAPAENFKAWAKKNPDWKIKIWGNKKLRETQWPYQNAINHMLRTNQMCGVADLMRYHILFTEGGMTLDADCLPVDPIPEWMAEQCPALCWENESIRTGLIALGFMYFPAGHEFMKFMIDHIIEHGAMGETMAWRAYGPLRLSICFRLWSERKNDVTIWPSRFFIPNHFAGNDWVGKGPVICYQQWNSTKEGWKQDALQH